MVHLLLLDDTIVLIPL